MGPRRNGRGFPGSAPPSARPAPGSPSAETWEGGAPLAGAGTEDLRNKAVRGGGARGPPRAGSPERGQEPRQSLCHASRRAHQYHLSA